MKPIKCVIKQDEVKSIIESIPFTSFFGTKFVKKDGTIRKMNCNRSIGILKENNHKITSDHIIVYDVNVEGYRTVNLNTISEIRSNGVKYIVE